MRWRKTNWVAADCAGGPRPVPDERRKFRGSALAELFRPQRPRIAKASALATIASCPTGRVVVTGWAA